MAHQLRGGSAEPLVSVIITAYNYGHTLATAIDSVLTQDHRRLEVLVMDNASSDATPEVMLRYRGDERVRSIRHERNVGMIPNHNAGLRLVHGEYIVFLSADDRLMPGMIRRSLAYYFEHPDIDILYTALYLMDAQGRLMGVRQHELPVAYDHPRDELPWLLACNGYICLPTLLVRRDIYETYGELDEEVFGADYDLTLRWAQAGLRFGYMPVHGAAFRIHAAQQTGVVNFSRTGKQVVDHLRILKSYVGSQNAQRLRGFEHRIALQAQRQFQLVVQEGFVDDGTVLAELHALCHSLEEMRERHAAGPYTTQLSIFVIPGTLPVHLEQTLLSLVAQTWGEFEVIVLEQPGLALGEWCAHLDPRRRIRSLQFIHHLNEAQMLNIAMSVADGNAYAFAAAGTRFPPGHTRNLIQALNGENALFITPLELTIFDQARRGDRYRQYFAQAHFDEQCAVAPPAQLSNLAFRRELLDDHFGFAEHLQAASIWDFCGRAAATVPLRLVDGAVEQDVYAGFPHPLFAPNGIGAAIEEFYPRHAASRAIDVRRTVYREHVFSLLADPAAAMASSASVAAMYELIYQAAVKRRPVGLGPISQSNESPLHVLAT